MGKAFGLALTLVMVPWLLVIGVGTGSLETTSTPEAEGRSEKPLWLRGPREADYPSLENLKQFTPRIYSGAEPRSGEAFRALNDLGIEVIVSVDAARPDVKEAQAHGLRYIHLPIGYDGISQETQLALGRLLSETSGHIYVHCHHGVHRGPAVAALAGRIADEATRREALKMLEVAGTSRKYLGLWRDVGRFRSLPADADPPDLVSQAEVNSLAGAMAEIDRHYYHLELAQKAGWQRPPDHPDLDPIHEARLMEERFQESLRQVDDRYDDRFVEWLGEAAGEAGQLTESLVDDEADQAARHWRAIDSLCRQCHDNYRN